MSDCPVSDVSLLMRDEKKSAFLHFADSGFCGIVREIDL